MNAYNMLQLLRDNIGEAVENHWTDVNLIHRMNVSQRKIAVLIGNYPGAWLQKSTDLSPVASVITLPADCAKPVYLEEKSSGQPLSWLGSVKTRRVSRGGLEVYALRNTLVVNQASYGTQVTLWYDQTVPDLMAGTASAGEDTGLTFPDVTNVIHIDDYYNGVSIQAEGGVGVNTAGDIITDYDGATRVCVVTGTYDATTIFGTLTRLPEESEPLILLDATVLALAKPSSNIDEKVFQYYQNERREAKRDLVEWLETRIKGHRRVEITEEGF